MYQFVLTCIWIVTLYCLGFILSTFGTAIVYTCLEFVSSKGVYILLLVLFSFSTCLEFVLSQGNYCLPLILFSLCTSLEFEPSKGFHCLLYRGHCLVFLTV